MDVDIDQHDSQNDIYLVDIINDSAEEIVFSVRIGFSKDAAQDDRECAAFKKKEAANI